jgi:hypothetical protein
MNGGVLMHGRRVGFGVTIHTSKACCLHLLRRAPWPNDIFVLRVISKSIPDGAYKERDQREEETERT